MKEEKNPLAEFEDLEITHFLEFPIDCYFNVGMVVTDLGLKVPCLMDLGLIPLFERAVNDTYEKLKEIHEKGGTHVHMHNMAFAFKRMIKELQLCYLNHHSVWGKGPIDLIVDDAVKRCDELLKVFDPIHDIFTSNATHAEKKLLLKPYWYDFWNTWCYTLNKYRYSFAEKYNELFEKVVEEYQRRKEERSQIQSSTTLKEE